MRTGHDAVDSRVDGARTSLVELSRAVHADAEIAFEEHTSADRVASALEAGGFEIESGVAELETAFVATAGSGELTIGICAEYDALPGIGHACGHNIIAAAATGAGLALASVADDLGITVKVFGTPAEERGGGKVLMLNAGVFDGVHAAMMVHPSPREQPIFPCLAVSQLQVTATGKTSHASAFPELGINAADALTVAQVGIGLLRQHLPATVRVHGIITDGGMAPNIVPGTASGEWFVRAETLEELAKVEARIVACFEGGGLAAGATIAVEPVGPPYSHFRHDADLAGSWLTHALAMDRPLVIEGVRSVDDMIRTSGSTDMANVSMAIPSIHPMMALPTNGAVNHQPEFTAACVTADADRAVRDGAVGMARTAVDAATTPALRERLLAGAPPIQPLTAVLDRMFG